MQGIYCFTNLVNNKKYIGQSVNLEARRKSHIKNYKNINSPQYSSLFYRALRKYGLNNFHYEILYSSDNMTKDELNEKEKYYIKLYDTFGENGYNMNIGGNYTSGPKILTWLQIEEIQNLLESSDYSLSEIANKYNVSCSTISQINSGNIWNEFYLGKYPIRENCYNIQNGDKNPNHKLTSLDVLGIRLDYQYNSLDEIYKKYKSKISKSGFKKVLYGSSFSNLPIYKKREKQWYLNGVCIDYPRLEEQGSQ